MRYGDPQLPCARAGTQTARGFGLNSDLARILLPELLRRVAVRTVVFAMALAMIVPLSVRSASPLPAETQQLLAAAGSPAANANRGDTSSRDAALAAQNLGVSIPAEDLAAGTLPTPGAVAARPQFRPAATPRPAVQIVAPPAGGTVVSGRASWYCCTAGYTGQAVVALPGAYGGHYDPPPASRYVTVCADRCARLPVVDYCACYWGTPNQKVVDLSPEAWAAISDGNRFILGVIPVTLHW